MFQSRKQRDARARGNEPRGLLEQAQDLGASYPEELRREDIELLRIAVPGQLAAALMEARAGARNTTMMYVIGVMAAVQSLNIEAGSAPEHLAEYNPEVFWAIAADALPGLDK